MPVILALFLACSSDDADPPGDPGTRPPVVVELASTAYDPDPQVPSILRDVAQIDDDVAYTNPYVPGHRTTMDGRVAIRVQGGTSNIDKLSTDLSFFLFSPESLDEAIMPGPAGVRLLTDPDGFDVPFPPAIEDGGVFRLGHHAICDPTTPMPQAGERTNPYPCGDDTLDDCYDITVISSTSPALSAQIWGTPVTVRVSAPKTPQARIAEVELGEPVKGALITSSTEWTEPAVTVDGRLMTGRLGRLPRDWTNPETGETFNRPYDLAYSVLSDDAEPCDVTGWTDFHPMSHAPYDPQMIGRYGLAAYPFRDTEGHLIPDGEDLGGTYPWVDREGANVFTTGVPGRIAEQSPTRFPRRCVHEGCEEHVESIDFDRGFMVAGLWTHGKLVHLDGMINNMDWAVGVHPTTHYLVDLYEDEAGQPVEVRFGSGRFIPSLRDDGSSFPAGYTGNANILDSLQQLLNHKPEARPVTPRDVVWLMSSGVATDEIAFDELLDPNALIVANMTASITQLYDGDASTGIPVHHNGQVRELITPPGPLAIVELDPEADDEIHLQNGATSLSWEVPAFGRVDAGTGRVEPVALGGIQGRGFWLTGDNAVVYELADQPEADGVAAYLGVYVDARTPDDEARELLRFGDDTGIVLQGPRVLYVAGDDVLHEIALPEGDGWRHLAWRIAADHQQITLLNDGFALDRFEADGPLFSLSGGPLTIGRQAAAWSGVRGWIDDFVVLLHDVDPEVACNHARGTLVDVGTDADATARATTYPSWAHDEVAAAAGSTATTFACLTDYRDDYAAHLANLPEGTVSVRQDILFPEGPLRVGAPRPDSTANPFCLSCHTAEGKGGLSLEALAYQPDLLAEDDRRRQPHQPPRRVFGNIPGGWIPAGEGQGSPSEALQAPPEGLVIDHWVLPPAE